MKIVETKFYGQLIVVSDYILLGILWVIVCLPVITIVPATCAVFYVMAQWKGEGSGNIIYFFFQGIKQHFGKNLFLSLLTIIIYFLVNQLLEEQTIVLSISGYVVLLIYSMFLLSWIYVISENKDITFLQIFEQSAWKVFFEKYSLLRIVIRICTAHISFPSFYFYLCWWRMETCSYYLDYRK